MVTDLVRVWIVAVDVPPAVLAACRDVLDEGERARAAAFSRPRDRQRFVVAHGALRILVGGQLEAPPSALRWIPGQDGKPELIRPWSGLLHTSLSHSADLIAVATCIERPVGVDIQHLLPELDPAALTARYFPSDEAEYVAAGADRDARADRFARLWARKEAAVKAAGGRLWPNLKVAVRDQTEVTLAEPASSHRVADLPAPSGFHAAVALAGVTPFEVATGTWPPDGPRVRLRQQQHDAIYCHPDSSR